MNDLPAIFSVLDIRMYADDTVLFCEIDRASDDSLMVEQINIELGLFRDWCRANYLTVNTSKTKCMIFSVKANSSQMARIDYSLRLNGQTLDFVNSYRYLGVELDTKLTMELHVNNIVKKVRPLLYTLAKLRHYIDINTSVRMYKTYVLPVLEFGVYLVDKPTLIACLQKLQNKALRICLRESNIAPSFPLHVKTNLLSLDLRRMCTLLNFMNMKTLRGDKTFPLVASTDNRTRTSGVRHYVYLPHTERYRRSISYAGPTAWNALPPDIRSNLYPVSFKKQVRKYYWSVFQTRKSVK